MFHISVTLVIATVVYTRPQAILLAMITIRKSMHGFPFLSYKYGALLDCPSGHRALLLIFGVEDS